MNEEIAHRLMRIMALDPGPAKERQIEDLVASGLVDDDPVLQVAVPAEVFISKVKSFRGEDAVPDLVRTLAFMEERGHELPETYQESGNQVVQVGMYEICRVPGLAWDTVEPLQQRLDQALQRFGGSTQEYPQVRLEAAIVRRDPHEVAHWVPRVEESPLDPDEHVYRDLQLVTAATAIGDADLALQRLGGVDTGAVDEAGIAVRPGLSLLEVGRATGRGDLLEAGVSEITTWLAALSRGELEPEVDLAPGAQAALAAGALAELGRRDEAVALLREHPMPAGAATWSRVHHLAGVTRVLTTQDEPERARQMGQQAVGLARAFDERNGSQRFSDYIRWIAGID